MVSEKLIKLGINLFINFESTYIASIKNKLLLSSNSLQTKYRKQISKYEREGFYKILFSRRDVRLISLKKISL